MERPRLAGGTLVTSRPSIRMRPPVTSSRPAIRRSKVVLPQPEGPTKTTNEPSWISSEAPWMILVAPNAFSTFSRVMLPICRSPAFLFHGAEGETAHQLLLTEPAKDQDWRDRQGRGCGELGP